MNSPAAGESCGTCYGKGTRISEMGPGPCTDCHGLGTLPSGSVLRERRLRDLERRYEGRQEDALDVRWLILEVRRAQHALLQILAAGQEAPESDAIASKIRHLANEVLGLYRPGEPRS